MNELKNEKPWAWVEMDCFLGGFSFEGLNHEAVRKVLTVLTIGAIHRFVFGLPMGGGTGVVVIQSVARRKEWSTLFGGNGFEWTATSDKAVLARVASTVHGRMGETFHLTRNGGSPQQPQDLAAELAKKG